MIYTSTGGWEQKLRLKLTSAKVVVEVEAELGKKYQDSSQKCSSWKYRDKCGGWLGTKLFGIESKLENYEKIQ